MKHTHHHNDGPLSPERILCALILLALIVQLLLGFAAGWFMRGGGL